MFKKGQLITFIFSIILFSQCKKIEIVPDTEGTPVFFVNLDTGATNPLVFAAGLDDYYLYTAFEQGTDGVYTFIGEFRKETNQTDSIASLRFEIRDREAFPPQVDINQALSIPSYSFFNENTEVETDTIFTANFTLSNAMDGCLLNLLPSDFHWDFGDGSDTFGFTPSHVYENNVSRIVKLTVDLGNNEEAVFEQTIHFDSSISPCSLEIQDTMIFMQNDPYIELSAFPGGGVAPYSYLWQDGSTASIYGQLLQDTFASIFYSVTVMDNAGCTISASGNIATNVEFAVCIPGFVYETAILIDTIPFNNTQLSTVTIIYIDENGKEFRSDLQTQNTAFFTIQNVENFTDNENGEKTKKMDVGFSCELFSNEGLPSINVPSGSGIIGIAYPN